MFKATRATPQPRLTRRTFLITLGLVALNNFNTFVSDHGSTSSPVTSDALHTFDIHEEKGSIDTLAHGKLEPHLYKAAEIHC